MIDNFLNNSKPIIENTGVNVIYFTNRCNLACTYCYEDLKDRPEQILTKEQIRQTIDTIIEREPHDHQTLFVLFGGEVTLEWDNAIYFMEYAYSKKKNIHFNISTNGIKFLSDTFILQYKKLKYNLLGLTSLDISFDGIGNKERITHSGIESTSFMLQIFRKLQTYNVQFRLRYTIHNGNINNLYDDIMLISKSIKPLRIIISVAWSTLTEDDLNTLKKAKEKLLTSWINKETTIPICELFCNYCNGCDIRKDIKTYFTNEGNVSMYKNNESSPKFNDFKEKEYHV